MYIDKRYTNLNELLFIIFLKKGRTLVIINKFT